MANEMNISNTMNISDTMEDDEITYRLVIATGIWQFICFIFGVPLNLLVLYLWYQYGQPDHTNRIRTSRQTHSHWFVASMTLADLITSAFYAPSIAVWYVLGHQFSQDYCKSLISIGQLSMVASSLSLLCLNLDKFLYLAWPVKYEYHLTNKRSFAAAITIWIVSIIWASTFITKLISTVERGCAYYGLEPISYAVFSIMFFILPTFLSLLISIHIAIIVSRYIGTPKRSEWMLDHLHNHNYQRSSTERRSTQVSYRSDTGQAKRTVFIFATTVWTAVTYLPYRCLIMLGPVVGLDDYSPLRFIFFGAMAANAVGNPVITLITLKSYRTPTQRIIRKLCCRRS